jgi:hypothetical protein
LTLVRVEGRRAAAAPQLAASLGGLAMVMKKAAILIVLLACAAIAFAAEERVKIPKQGWSISFDSPRLSDKQESKHDGDYAFKATAERFNISLFVEKPHGAGSTHKDCYEFYWPQASRNPMIAKDTVQISETSKYVRVQYDIVTEFQGKPIRQLNVNYYFAYSGEWIDLHISIIAPSQQDSEVIAAFDRSLSYGM